ncbi:MAG: oligopeptide ABC transporter permease OppB [Gammaproteobacteria bacterium]|nr:oligopeptide ABC transporter permease OppB [Gammaproteobacteria bacterium]MXW45811.1 oligopeptide ABC transporter permease OppB [Gammaproteobacteria bacterium]MYD03175.1 oligopeptide ABC transporter permease OppB [Gammaproteobacteria bacterium]MYI25798.1 oligopeptide ABC transporter permease OppB [Gammaproteobacteria bacterium]
MLSYALRRLLVAVPTLFVIVTVSFFLIRVAPGGPFDLIPDLDPAAAENLRKAYDLDKPLVQQYGNYLLRLANGDLGPSLAYRDRNVAELISEGLPVSAQLGLTAIAVGLFFGMLCGIVAALRKNTAVDFTIMAIAMTGVAIPTFVTAPLLTLFFGLYLGWLPLSGWNNGQFAHIVLPVVALALPTIAGIARITRGSMLESLNADYVRTARAKGLPEWKVIARHVLRPACMPVVSYLGPAIAGAMTGSVVIETIFGLPGIGRAFVEGALNRDYSLILGIVIIYATLIILLNLLADVIYGYLDPRVRRK